MGVQFARVEAYSVGGREGSKRPTADGVIAEAVREAGFCDHVENPRPPQFVLGDESELGRMQADIDTMAVFGQSEIAKKGGGTRTRKLAKDAPILAAVVLSYPGRTPALVAEWKEHQRKAKEAKREGKRPPPPPESWKAYKKWQDLAVGWLQKQYGDQLRCVVAHHDEGHPHLHAFVLARVNHANVVTLRGLHPGRDAKESVRKAGKDKGETDKEFAGRQMKAYKTAMKAWQDDYHEGVAKACGQARLGPARRRMTRGEWKAEKVATRERVTRQDAMENKVKRLEAELATARTEAAAGKKATERLDAVLDPDNGDAALLYERAARRQQTPPMVMPRRFAPPSAANPKTRG